MGRDQGAAERHVAAREPPPPFRGPGSEALAGLQQQQARRGRIEQPRGRCREGSPRLRPPGLPPQRDRRRREAVRRTREEEARGEAVLREGGSRWPRGDPGVAGLPVPPREARQTRRLRTGLAAVVLPLEYDAR